MPTLKATVSTPVSSQPLLLGKTAWKERKSIGTLSAFEQNALEGMLDTLKKDIALGEEFVNK